MVVIYMPRVVIIHPSDVEALKDKAEALHLDDEENSSMPFIYDEGTLGELVGFTCQSTAKK